MVPISRVLLLAKARLTMKFKCHKIAQALKSHMRKLCFDSSKSKLATGLLITILRAATSAGDDGYITLN